MDVDGMLEQLYIERDAVDQSILALVRLAEATGFPKRGRRPKWLTEAKERREKSVKSRQIEDSCRSGDK